MKKLLNILSAISLIGTSTLGIVSCKIDILDDGKRNDVGYWNQMFPIDQPFKKVDNKYFAVIWRTSTEDYWKINLFNFKNSNITNVGTYDKYIIEYSIKQGYNSGLMLVEQKDWGNVLIKRWEDDAKENKYFKSLYNWNDNSIPTVPKLDDNGNIII
ncbi:lipoprotein [Spiroplasma endosymbiont of Stenodema calcarata]|uniref:lipoprotein n=1 Tax=Spiroplasma endosymbiont of Stenodema calcarata TaxID=3139328 RepID=UPI003CCB624D